MTRLDVRGFAIFKNALSPQAQEGIVAALRDVLRTAPLFRPVTPSGKPMSVRMTSAGRYGWVSDKARGYRYDTLHPSGAQWPDIPENILEIWRSHVGRDRLPDCCLINFYGPDTKMGLHQDKDEADFSWPVLSVSLGDDALFRMGGQNRRDGTESIWLGSGDVVVMGGEARLAFHGIDRIRHGTSRLLPKGGRINLTMRVVD